MTHRHQLLFAVVALISGTARAQAPLSPPAPASAAMATTDGDATDDETTIEMDIPQRIDPAKPFLVSVWVPGATEKTTIHADHGSDVSYKPAKVTVAPGERATVECELINKTPASGLVQLVFSSDCCATRSATIDAGFRLKVRPLGLEQGLVAGDQKMIAFEFVNDQGQRVPLDAPLSMTVIASRLILQDGPKTPPSVGIHKIIDRGASVTPFTWLSPGQTLLGAAVEPSTTLAVEIRNSHGGIVVREPFVVPIRPNWIAQMLAAVGGSLLWLLLALTANAERRERRQIVAGFGLAMVSGVIAFVLTKTKLIGLEAGGMEIAGFVSLGLLVGGSGAESIVRALASKVAVAGGPRAA